VTGFFFSFLKSSHFVRLKSCDPTVLAFSFPLFQCLVGQVCPVFLSLNSTAIRATGSSPGSSQNQRHSFYTEPLMIFQLPSPERFRDLLCVHFLYPLEMVRSSGQLFSRCFPFRPLYERQRLSLVLSTPLTSGGSLPALKGFGFPVFPRSVHQSPTPVSPFCFFLGCRVSLFCFFFSLVPPVSPISKLPPPPRPDSPPRNVSEPPFFYHPSSLVGLCVKALPHFFDAFKLYKQALVLPLNFFCRALLSPSGPISPLLWVSFLSLMSSQIPRSLFPAQDLTSPFRVASPHAVLRTSPVRPPFALISYKSPFEPFSLTWFFVSPRCPIGWSNPCPLFPYPFFLWAGKPFFSCLIRFPTAISSSAVLGSPPAPFPPFFLF